MTESTHYLTIKVSGDIKSYSSIINYAVFNSHDVILDLSDLTTMDIKGFKYVDDLLPKLKAVIPPKDTHIIKMYDLWLDSKKGLSK